LFSALIRHPKTVLGVTSKAVAIWLVVSAKSSVITASNQFCFWSFLFISAELIGIHRKYLITNKLHYALQYCQATIVIILFVVYMAESTGKTIRFPKLLLEAIQKCADAREKSFSEVVVETCEARHVKHEPTLSDRVTALEGKVIDIEARL
jgi:type IV secretory pathway VirB3-like protein